MRVTIIVEDRFCSVDGQGFDMVDMSSVPAGQSAVQWYETWGEVEYFPVDGIKPVNTRIESLDPYQQVIDSYEQIKYEHEHPPVVPPTAEQNQRTASSLLYGTDWTQIPSVSDPTQSNPYLTNAAEFAAWRQQIREIALNPVAGDINFPTQPTALWA